MEKGTVQDLIRRYYKGTQSPGELDQLADLLEGQHPEVKDTLFEIWNEEQDYSRGTSPEGMDEVLQKIHHQISKDNKSVPGPRITRWMNPVLKLAAVLLLGVMVWLVADYMKKNESQTFAMATPAGSVSQVWLPDSSRVFLNAGSQISYTARKKGNRELTLTGEAWFEIKKQNQQPFIVHTPYYSIKVLGTRFNVYAFPKEEEIVTTLEEGSIEIISSGNLKLTVPIRLNPGDQITYNTNSKKLTVKEVSPNLYSSWKDNKLVFVNASLKEMILKLERHYNMKIEVQDSSLLDYHYDLTIKNETIDDVLGLLQETLPLTYEISDSKIIIRKE